MKDKALYTIGIVSEMLMLHPQTIRQYERTGLIKPSRTDGNTRRYSEEDVEKLKYIIHLTKNIKVNIAGVEIIMALNEEIQKLKSSLEKIQNSTDEFNNGNDIIKIKIKKQ